MTIFLLFVFILCIYKIKPAKPVLTGYNEHYFDISRTESIKGLFILLVFLSHARNYLMELPSYSSDILNRPYNIFQEHIGQGIVVMFLLYSGYGVMEAIKRKGSIYVNSIPVKRVMITWLNFALAVVLFAIEGLALGTYKKWTALKIILSLIGWDSLGNSNWYIFVILIMYIITFVSFKLFRKNYSHAAACTAVLTFVYIVAVSRLKAGEAWWFDTALCYPFGMFISLQRERLEGFIFKKPVNYYAALILCAAVFAVCHLKRGNIFCYEAQLILFGVVIILVLMKLDVNNKVLRFFGKHLFEMYILMRIPMSILLHFNITNTYLFVCISFVITVLAAVIFKKLLAVIDSAVLKLFGNKKTVNV